jgi:hypothetical protein
METAALNEVRSEIEALYAHRGKDFLLPARYKTLLNVEASLVACRKARQVREDRTDLSSQRASGAMPGGRR